MKIIKPSTELVDKINPDEILKKIELCGRVSHQSKPHENSTEQFVRMLIKRGHESVLEHVSLTFHIICDRAIMAELTRHRLAAFTVESTRYVKYGELTFINPPDIEFVECAECAYDLLLRKGATPEIARAVLPQCLKSEL